MPGRIIASDRDCSASVPRDVPSDLLPKPNGHVGDAPIVRSSRPSWTRADPRSRLPRRIRDQVHTRPLQLREAAEAQA